MKRNGHKRANGQRKRHYAPRRAHQRQDPRRMARARQELEYAVPALPQRAGYCDNCRVIRLSHADYGGLCMFCRADALRAARPPA